VPASKHRKRSGFAQWRRNGRLATVALVIVGSVYLTLLLCHVESPRIADAFTYVLALWCGNIAFSLGKETPEVRKPDDDDE
jgi:hypothetical protein